MYVDQPREKSDTQDMIVFPTNSSSILIIHDGCLNFTECS